MHDYREAESSELYKKVFAVSVTVHPLYDGKTIHGYDIAIIRLNETLIYNKGIQPICLPQPTQTYRPDTKLVNLSILKTMGMVSFLHVWDGGGSSR